MKDFRVADRHGPVLALDGQILFPLATVVLRLRKEGAERLLQASTANHGLVVVLQKNPEGGLHHTGTLAEVETSRSSGTGWDVTVKGLARIRAEQVTEEPGLSYATYDFSDESFDLDEATGQVLLSNIKSISAEILGMIEGGRCSTPLRIRPV